MSDSQLNKNNSVKSGAKKVIKDPVNSASVFPKNGISTPAYLLITALLLGLAWFGFIIFKELQASQKQDSSKNSESLSATAQPNEPLSILPKAPEGITILEKQAELVEQSPTPQITVTSGAVTGNKIALILGKALSFAELSAQFAEIVNANGPENFNTLQPRALLTETINGLEALLLVGPFDSEQLALEACEVLIIPASTTLNDTLNTTTPNEFACETTIFEGELISRE